MYNALARVERCSKIGRDMVKLVVDSDVADLGQSLCRAFIGGFEEDDSLQQSNVYGEILACSGGKCCS